MTIGKRIRHFREKSGLTQTQLGEKVGLALPTIYKYENDILKNIPLSKIEKLAAALSITPGQLVGWKDSPQATLLKKYKLLNKKGKAQAERYIDELLANSEFTV